MLTNDKTSMISIPAMLREAKAMLAQERNRRLKVEQELGGLRSANLKLQALVLHHKAEAARLRAETGGRSWEAAQVAD